MTPHPPAPAGAVPDGYRRGNTIPALFGRCVRERPGDTALVHGTVRLTYAELDDRSDAYAAELMDAGVRRGDYVAVLLRRSADTVAVLLAVLKCGAAYAAIDPAWPAERLAWLLEKVRPRLLVSQDPRIRWDGPRWQPAAGPHSGRRPAPVALDGADPCAVFFTSGSTGEPKGVVLPHRGAARLFDEGDFADFGPGTALPQLFPLHWDGPILDLWGPLMCGGTSVLVDDVMQPDVLRALAAREGVNGAVLPTAVFNMIVDEDAEAFAGLRWVITGSEKVSPAHLERLLRRFPELRLLNGYGPVESSALVTIHPITLTDTEDPHGVPIGRAMAHSSVYVLDGDRECAPGETGEICLGGDGLALEYLGDPERTAASFAVLPLRGEQVRVYRTGDLGRFTEDGLLYFAGRADRQVKIRGHRIEPGEVEHAAEAVAGVASCAVTVLPGRDGAAGSLALFYVPAATGAPDPDELRATLAARLPGYLVPRDLHRIDRLPVTSHGKVDHAALTDLALRRRTPARPAPTSGHDAPAVAATTESRTAERAHDAAAERRRRLEATVTGIVADLFPGTSAGRDEDFFFDLGANSLEAARLCARVGAALGVRIPVSQIFRAPTIAGLTAWLSVERPEADLTSAGAGMDTAASSTGPSAAAQDSDTSPSAAAQDSGTGLSAAFQDADASPSAASQHTDTATVPLTLGQAAYLGSPAGLVCLLAWRVTGPLNLDALGAALTDVHRRHQTLHARYRTEDGRPVALLPADPGAVALHRLPDVPDDEAAIARLRAELAAPLDPERGLIWRAAAVRHPGGLLLGVGVHHIAFDGSSEDPLAVDLAIAYTARAAGSAPVWPAPAPSLAALAAEEQARLAGVDQEAQLRYWVGELRSLRAPALPGVRPGPLPPAGPTAHAVLPISADALAAWDAHARTRHAGRTAYLIAAFAQVLRELTGRAEVGVLLPVAARGSAALDAAIVSRLDAVCLRLPAPTERADPLDQTRHVVGAALTAQDVPLREVMTALAAVRPDIHTLLSLPIFLHQDHERRVPAFPGCTVALVLDDVAADQAGPLAVEVLPTSGGGARLRVTVRTDRCPADLADRIAAAYQRLLADGPGALRPTAVAAH